MPAQGREHQLYRSVSGHSRDLRLSPLPNDRFRWSSGLLISCLGNDRLRRLEKARSSTSYVRTQPTAGIRPAISTGCSWLKAPGGEQVLATRSCHSHERR